MKIKGSNNHEKKKHTKVYREFELRLISCKFKMVGEFHMWSMYLRMPEAPRAKNYESSFCGW